MKKIIALILALVLLGSLSACGKAKVDLLGLPEYKKGTYVAEKENSYNITKIQPEDFTDYVALLKSDGFAYDPMFFGSALEEELALDMDFWSGTKGDSAVTVYLMVDIKTMEHYISVSVSRAEE